MPRKAGKKADDNEESKTPVKQSKSTHKEKSKYNNNVESTKKDKNAPKRPLTAYFCYMKTRREKLKKEEPDLTNTGLVAVSSGNNRRKLERSGSRWMRMKSTSTIKWLKKIRNATKKNSLNIARRKAKVKVQKVVINYNEYYTTFIHGLLYIL